MSEAFALDKEWVICDPFRGWTKLTPGG